MMSFSFRARCGKLNWRLISSIDLNDIIDNRVNNNNDDNINELQLALDIVTFCDFNSDDVRNNSIDNVTKLVKLMQLMIEYLLYCQEKQCELINVINNKNKDLKNYKHRLAKENAGLIEDAKIYKKQLDLLRISLAKSQKLMLQKDFRHAPPRVVLDRILKSSESKEVLDVTNDWLAYDDNIESTAPAVIVESILQHEKETRDFMQKMLEEQRSYFYDETKIMNNKNTNCGQSNSSNHEMMSKLRDMFENMMETTVSSIKTTQHSMLEKLIDEFTSRQEYILKAAKDKNDNIFVESIDVPQKAGAESADDIEQRIDNEKNLKLKITFLEQRINEYEQHAEQMVVIIDEITELKDRAKKDNTTIIDLKRSIIKHENEKIEGATVLLLCSMQKAIYKRYSKYFSRWFYFNVMSRQSEIESNYQNILDRMTIEYDNEHRHLTEESSRKQKELADRIDSETRKNIINEARINHTKSQIAKAKEEELEKRSRRAEAAIMTSIDFSSIPKEKISKSTDCQTNDIANNTVSVTTSMSELPLNLKELKEKEESLKKIDEKYLKVNHEDELMTITQNKIASSRPQNSKEDVHTSLVSEIAKRLKQFHF